MATARSVKPRGAVKPKPAPRPRIAVADVLPALDEGEDLVFELGPERPEPEPEPEPECRFPFEVKNGRCPVAVFNSPDSPNERIAFAEDERKHPLRYDRGLLAVFTDEDAQIVRNANPRGKVYVEADPDQRKPLMCSTCFPKTRWYSTEAFERHIRRFHTNG